MNKPKSQRNETIILNKVDYLLEKFVDLLIDPQHNIIQRKNHFNVIITDFFGTQNNTCKYKPQKIETAVTWLTASFLDFQKLNG